MNKVQKKQSLVVVILTYNEELHIARAISSVSRIADQILVVDSYSEDSTVEIALGAGAEVIKNKFINHAAQLNWALESISKENDWVLRLDADEIVTTELSAEIEHFLYNPDETVAGLALNRRIVFMGKPIRWGGLFPLRVTRLFRNGRGRSEPRWMDEHIIVDGTVLSSFRGELHDVSLHSLTRWIDKHNNYASREAFEILKSDLGMDEKSGGYEFDRATVVKRLLKEQVYYRMPAQARPLLYFLYRYFVRLGFLDGVRGSAFHVLQGFWYRYLVELKVHEVRRRIGDTEEPASKVIADLLGVEI